MVSAETGLFVRMVSWRIRSTGSRTIRAVSLAGSISPASRHGALKDPIQYREIVLLATKAGEIGSLAVEVAGGDNICSIAIAMSRAT